MDIFHIGALYGQALQHSIANNAAGTERPAALLVMNGFV